jgi:TrmH family RNA methyltransferase
MTSLLPVTSAANPTVKALKALHLKKGRGESGLFLAEGARLAIEAAELGIFPQVLAVSQAALERAQVRAFVTAALRAGARGIVTSEAVLAQISKRDNPQTVIGAYRQRWAELGAWAPRDGAAPFVVALEGIRDPGNFGTIVRTADSVGADAVVLIGQTCDPFSVEAVRATMGSIFSVPIARADFASFDAWRRKAGVLLVGASLNGDTQADWPAERGVALFMGNEQSGLSPEHERACDHLVRLPMRGRADSLNLAIAAGVLMYDVWRRRGYAGARP